MGQVREPKPVKLIVAIMFTRQDKLEQTKEKLGSLWGKIDLESRAFEFHHSKYYNREMGTEIQKQFFSFAELIPPNVLPDIKLETNQMELDLSAGSGQDTKLNRIINLDPGYISPAKLVLATTKNYDHRIYIGKGIYAEVTLHFTQGKFHAWPWTYFDYQSQLALDFFTKVRNRYFEQLDEIGLKKVETID